jgi:hypothetical protein
MRTKVLVLFGLGALALAVLILAAPNAATRTPVVTGSVMDVPGLTKAAKNLPEQSFPAH